MLSPCNFQEKWLQEIAQKNRPHDPRGTKQNSFTARFWEWGAQRFYGCGILVVFLACIQESKEEKIREKIPDGSQIVEENKENLTIFKPPVKTSWLVTGALVPLVSRYSAIGDTIS